jgi:cytochrome c556
MFKPLPAVSLLVACICLLAACSGEVEDTRPGQPVKTRQTAFKEMLRSFEPMGVMLRDNRYNADKFLTLTQELIARREAPWSHFAAGTDYPPSKALPAVWSEADKFEANRKAFFKVSDELLLAAASKDVKAARRAYDALHDTCRDCHRNFKVR